MGLIGCIRVLCRAVSWSSGMPDDNSEARPLCARRQCSTAAGSQQISRARSELSQRAALRPRPAWPAPPPSWPLLAVCAAAHMQARGALRAIVPIQCAPPCLYAFRRGAWDDARGSSRSSKGRSSASSSHSFPGTWATDRNVLAVSANAIWVARARAWRGYRGRGSEPHAERELEERGGASEASARGGSESGRCV